MRAFLIFALLLTACGPRSGTRPCREIPEARRPEAAETFLQCVEGATATTTGENQDADDWVRACRYSTEEIHSAEGFQGWAADCWDCNPYPTTPCQAPKPTRGKI